MAKQIHRIVSLADDKRTGVCAYCGPVAIKQKKNPNGKVRYACRIAEKRWTGKPREGLRRRMLGVSPWDVEEMLAEQRGLCAMCAATLDTESGHRGFHVDHDHDTREVRAILCPRCNVALGLLGDSSAMAQNAVAYLRRFGR